jgi:hypothetical protein
MSPSAFRAERSYLLPDGSVGTIDVAALGRSAHHPGITPGRVIRGAALEDCGRSREVAGQRVPASALPLSAGATSPSSWPIGVMLHQGTVATADAWTY